MQSIENKIVERIKKCGRGKLLFPADFMRYGEPKSVQKAFESLANKDVIIRVCIVLKKVDRFWLMSC